MQQQNCGTSLIEVLITLSLCSSIFMLLATTMLNAQRATHNNQQFMHSMISKQNHHETARR